MKTKKCKFVAILLLGFLYSINNYAQPDPGNTLSFDGVNEYTLGKKGYDVNTGNFTVEAWIFPEAYVKSGIVTQGGYSYKSGYLLDFNAYGNHELRFETGLNGTNNGTVISPANAVVTNFWQHVAVSVTRGTIGNLTKMYINGKLVASGNIAPGDLTEDSLFIGAILNKNNFFKGKIDEVRIWNYARTENEILEFIHQPLAGSETGLVTYYTFNQSFGSVVLDISNQGNDGTVYNMDNSNWKESFAIIQPVMKDPANINASGFTLSWLNIPDAAYYLDISTHSDFSVLDILNNTSIGSGTSYNATGLPLSTTFYCRLRSFTVKSSLSSIPITAVTTMTVPGNALDFDGVNDYIQVPDHTSLDTLNQLTIEAWIKTNGTNWKNIVMKGNYGFGLSITDIKCGGAGADYLAYWIDGQCGNTIRSGRPIENNVWQHIAVVVSTKPTKTVSFYINGEEAGHYTTSNIAIQNGALGDLFLGQQGSGCACNYFQGLMDEVRIWNTARSEQDIQNNMYNSLSGTESGLIALFNFDQVTGNKLHDLTGNLNDGILNNMDNNDWKESFAMITPIARLSSHSKPDGFTANWDSIPFASKYFIQISKDNNFGTTVLYDSTSTPFYPAKGLETGVVYYYRIKSLTWKNSEYSNVIQAVTGLNSPGNALDFDGSDDYIQFNSPMDNKEFTFEAWIKASTKVNRCVIFSTKYLGCANPNTSAAYRGLALHINKWSSGNNDNSRNLMLEYPDGTTGCKSLTSPDGFVPFNEWIHVAVTTSEDSIFLYANGNLLGSALLKNRWLGACNMRIGNSQYVSGSLFHGQMDDVRIWHKYKTRKQIIADMHKPLTGKEDNLFAYYNFDCINGNTLPDITINKNNGTLMNMNNSDWIESYAVIRPFLRNPTDIGQTQFTAHWDTVQDAQKYYIEISTQKTFGILFKTDSSSVASYTAKALSPGMVYYYRVKAYTWKKSDYSDIGEIFTLMSPPGNALDFDGIDDRVDIPLKPELTPPVFSVACWAKVEGNTNSWRTVVCNRGFLSGFNIYASESNTWQFWFGDNIGWNVLEKPEPIIINQWYYLAATYDGTEYKFYVNGELAISKKGIYVLNTENPFRIGCLSELPQYYFNGKIDEVCYWKKTLTPVEVNTYMHTYLTGEEDSLIVYYDFNEIKGAVLPDKTVNKLNGIVVNMPESSWQESFAVMTPFAREATAIDTSGFTARWDSIPEAKKYYIDIATDQSFTTIVKSDSTFVHSYKITGLMSGTQYYYRAKSLTWKKSAWSNTIKTYVPMLIPGNSLRFDGANDNFDIPPLGSELTNITVECWLNMYQLSGWNIIWNYDAWSPGCIHIEFNNQKILLAINGNNPADFYSSGNFNTGQLYHVAFSYSASEKKSYLYINGELTDSISYNTAIKLINAPSSIGSWLTEPRYSKGQFDEFRIWNTIRTPQQIFENMHEPLKGNEPGLLLYYTFDKKSGSACPDLSNNQLNGTLVNMNDTSWKESFALITPFTRKATDIDTASFTAYWDSIPGAVKYYIEVSDSIHFKNLLKKDSTTVHQYPVTGLLSGKIYYYRVKAKTWKNSDYSNVTEVRLKLPVPGNALDFDGINDYVITSLNNTKGPEITIEYWFRGSNAQSVVRQQDFSDNYIVSGWNGKHILSNDGGTGGGVSVGKNIHDGKWHHVAMTWKQNTVNGFTSYLDGNLIEQKNSSNIPIPYISNNVILGSYNGIFEFAKGTIDEVRIWNICRTKKEIEQNMHRALKGDEAGLLAYYNFDVISGSVLPDQAKKGYHGALKNMNDTCWKESFALITPFTRNASNISKNGFTANWDTIPDAIEYFIDISKDSAFSSILFHDTITLNSKTYSSLAEGTTYYYRTQARTWKNSAYSNTTAVITDMTVPGNTLTFDGVNDYITADKVSNENYKSGMTVEAWVKADSAMERGVVWSFHATNYTNRNILFYEGKKLKYYDDDIMYYSTDSLPDDLWMHVAVVIQPFNKGYLYINGDTAATFQTGVLPSAGGKFSIGQEYDNTLPTDFFNGYIDDIRVWKIPRTKKQILDNMHKPVKNNEPGLVAYYNFDRISGNVLPDKSINAFDGTMHNMTDSSWKESFAVIQPTAREATDISTFGFTAHWDSIPGVSDYYLDVTTDSAFNTIDILDSALVNTNHYNFSLLSDTTAYYYRLRYAYPGTFDYSNSIKTITFERKAKIFTDGDTIFCNGDSVKLYTLFSSNTLYQWYVDKTPIVGQDTTFYIVKTSGKYNFRSIDTLHKDTAYSDIINITVNNTDFDVYFQAVDSVFPTPNHSGKFKVEFINKTPLAANYQYTWYFGDGKDTVSDEKNVIHIYEYNGTYTVKVIATHKITGCTDESIKTDYVYCEGGVDCPLSRAIFPYTDQLVCTGDSIEFYAFETAATAYEWYYGNDILVGTNRYFYAKMAGTYYCKIINSFCHKYSDKRKVTFLLAEKPLLHKKGTLRICSNDSMLITVANPKFFNAFLWSTGETNDSIYINQEGDYSVTATNIDNGCKIKSEKITITTEPISAPEICLVTIDTATEKNMIIWERDSSVSVDYYIVYKESTQAGVYDSIGYVPGKNMTVFVDFTSTPKKHADRYKIAYVDTCSNKSPQSKFHKTMFLVVNLGINVFNLGWDHYQTETGNMIFSTYYIYKGYNQDSLLLMDSIQSSLNYFTDNLFDTTKTLYFRIGLFKKPACYPSSLEKETGGPFTQSISNLDDNGIFTTINLQDLLSGNLIVYPNPFRDMAMIVFDNPDNKPYVLSLRDISGKVVKTMEEIRTNGLLLQREGLPSGFYLIELKGEKIFRAKIVVE